eukprot:scaffold97958_cov18-Tisochrysis_lutea.AAC.2
MCVGLAILDGSKQAALAPQEPIKFCACGWAPSVMLFALAKVPVMQLFSKRWWSGLALFAFAQSLPQHCAFVFDPSLTTACACFALLPMILIRSLLSRHLFVNKADALDTWLDGCLLQITSFLQGLAVAELLPHKK